SHHSAGRLAHSALTGHPRAAPRPDPPACSSARRSAPLTSGGGRAGAPAACPSRAAAPPGPRTSPARRRRSRSGGGQAASRPARRACPARRTRPRPPTAPGGRRSAGPSGTSARSLGHLPLRAVGVHDPGHRTGQPHPRLPLVDTVDADLAGGNPLLTLVVATAKVVQGVTGATHSATSAFTPLG